MDDYTSTSKEKLPLSHEDRISLKISNKIWKHLLPLLWRLYLIIALVIIAIAIVVWLRIGILAGLAIWAFLTFALLIKTTLWPNVLRTLELVWGIKYRLETSDYKLIQEGETYRLILYGGKKKEFTVYQIENIDPTKSRICIEYTPLTKTVLFAEQLL